MKILVAGVGNVFLGDDGFGVEVARRLSERLDRTPLPDGVVVGDFGIRGIHLAYELSAYDTTILIDAAPRGEEPGTLYALELGQGEPQAAVDAHGMTPEVVLGLVGAVGGEMRRVLLVGCEPADVAPGMELSAPVAAAIEPAVRLVRELIEEELRDHQATHGGAVT
ncbi:hydrogenase maturation protease [Actinoallomurus sp. NBC_01490]|uniref:hydrogenase maturation protease n=1 Tax=Actinoallomurus sp. NBC_01490 TaxID=2903557 RepID=UPI002E35AEE7|nr:hydrogenase maturation protease [Actinoallomurus sp. NBC_01490]